jgi:Na+-driven multidrug efflux pump
MGFAQGAQPIIGFNYGAGNYDRVKSAAKYCAVFCLAFSLLLWGVAVFFPKLPVRVFTDEDLRGQIRRVLITSADGARCVGTLAPDARHDCMMEGNT